MLSEYGINSNEMLLTLENIHSGLTSIIVKNNFTRIVNKIFLSLESVNDTEMLSDNETF